MISNTVFGSTLVLILLFSVTEPMVCPDGHSKCRDDMTCCKLSSDRYGCCPLSSAQCCADGMHCCPSDTKCNNIEGSCDYLNDDDHSLRMNISPNHLCPDKNKTCHESETCCKLKTGGYGCCSFSSAVCCKDMLHCCPHGTRCDLIHKQCVRPSSPEYHFSTDAILIKTSLVDIDNKNTSIVCPGGQYHCPDGNTCCVIRDKQWGCCPLTDAVCCEDRIHCCPNGYKCSQSGCQLL